MKKNCRFLLGARFFKNFIEQIKWMDACKKIHITPVPKDNYKSTLENTPPIVADLAKTRLVETTDHKYVIRMSK